MTHDITKNGSSEIAERLQKYKAEIFGGKLITIGGIGWQHGDLIQLLELAERDTRERCAQLAESQIINWSNNLCDESHAETTTVKPYSAGPITFGGESKKYAAECLASCAVAVAERIRGKE